MTIKKIFIKKTSTNIGFFYKYIFLAIFGIFFLSATVSFVLAASVSDSFTTEANISGGVGRETTNVVGVNGTAPFGGLTIAPCYSPVSPWTLVGTDPTINVRDVSSTYSTFIHKDIYCDTVNCILWPPSPHQLHRAPFALAPMPMFIRKLRWVMVCFGQ